MKQPVKISIDFVSEHRDEFNQAACARHIGKTPAYVCQILNRERTSEKYEPMIINFFLRKHLFKEAV